MPRPYKPKPIQKPRMDMGMMSASSPTPNNIDTSLMVDPSSVVWHHMTRENQMKMYKSAVKRTNQRMRELEKQGMTDSAIYTSLKTKGYTTKEGNVGFSTAGSKEWSQSTLKKEYEKVYRAYNAPTSSASKKAYEERTREMLSHIGVDYDEMMKDPERYKKELNEFWSLYNEAKAIGLWSKFGLGSYEAQEIVKEFMQSRDTMPKQGRGARQVAMSALKKVERLEKESSENPNMLKDAYLQQKLVTQYNKDKLKSARDALLNKIALHEWGYVPIENVSTGEEEKDYLL